MSPRLPASASVASRSDGAKLHAPAAARNADVIKALLTRHAPAQGRALELASGTGQHVQRFAQAFPQIVWQPSELDEERLSSIDAYRAEAGLDNLLPALQIDACGTQWAKDLPPQDLIVTINIAHLVAAQALRNLIAQTMAALAPQGVFILYGPFKRSGRLTSDGDVQFDAELRHANPDIGYRSDDDVTGWVQEAGFTDVAREEMPANNLALIATR